jgi:hypothetical protein
VGRRLEEYEMAVKMSFEDTVNLEERELLNKYANDFIAAFSSTSLRWRGVAERQGHQLELTRYSNPDVALLRITVEDLRQPYFNVMRAIHRDSETRSPLNRRLA